MKIYKNNVVVHMEIEELIEVLESGTFDNLLDMLIRLDDKIEAQYEMHDDFDLLDEGFDIMDFLDEQDDSDFEIHYLGSIDIDEDFDEDDFDLEEILNSFSASSELSREDKKVRKILNRFKHVGDLAP